MFHLPKARNLSCNYSEACQLQDTKTAHELKDKYYNTMKEAMKQNSGNEDELTSLDFDENADNVINNAINYTAIALDLRDGNGGDKDGLINYDEWATEVTFKSIGLDYNIGVCHEMMQKCFDAMDLDKDGNLNEKELLSMYLFRDAVDGETPPNYDETLNFNAKVNTEETSKNISGNLLQLAQDNETSKKLLLDIYGTLFQDEGQEMYVRNLEKEFGYNPNLETNSKVKNDYYEGEAYHIKQTGDIMTITDSSGNETTVDLEELCSELPLEYRIKIKANIQQLPAETIIDLINETHIMSGKLYDGERAYYTSADDSVNLPVNRFMKNIEDYYKTGRLNTNNETGDLVHETGHAIDLLANSSSSFQNKFNDVFEGEMNNYTKNHERYSENSSNQITNGDSKNYATWNAYEMFAECYQLLMTGEASSAECILEYFPNTLEAAKENIEYVRTLQEQIRHKI